MRVAQGRHGVIRLKCKRLRRSKDLSLKKFEKHWSNKSSITINHNFSPLLRHKKDNVQSNVVFELQYRVILTNHIIYDRDQNKKDRERIKVIQLVNYTFTHQSLFLVIY
jgi:hypothetical protein